jgi:intracellular sulfur oxidation DsrE/DsrF family protein
MTRRIKGGIFLFLVFSAFVYADEQIAYAPSKVVYDISTSDPEALGLIFDRVNMLQNVYQNDSFEASIVLVIHEGAIPLFGANDKSLQPELMQRARSLSLGEIIKFRVCKASAAMQGFNKNDLQDFVVMVPMADAEIIKLQQEGYAYLR